MFNTSIILNTDSYKASHYLQYPPGISHVSSYIEARGGLYQQLVFFGLQAFLREYLSRPITAHDITSAEAVLTQHGLPFNRAGWEYILHEHHGLLPLHIDAVAEGTVLPVGNVLVQVVNTDPACFWLTSYIETALLRAIWYPTTVATVSWHIKQIIRDFLHHTADDLSSLPFKLHDFGARGASSLETAALGGAAHLLHFQGTDTVAALLAAQQYYDEPMAGFSIPGAEHTTITSWGKAHEQDAYANMLQQFAGTGKVVAVVSDSYDLWHALDELWGNTLKEAVMSNGGILVIRPDSGNPVAVVSATLHKLMHHFGYHTNSKGYRVLPNYLRIIQGDGISAHSIQAILTTLQAQGISAENVSFGMGAELLQKVNRDTLAFAMKASAVQVNGVWQNIAKTPVTDQTKASKQGRLALLQTQHGYRTVALDQLTPQQTNQLLPVFRNGSLLQQYTFTEIRARISHTLNS